MGSQVADSLSHLETAGDYSLQPKVFWKAVRHLKLQPNVEIFCQRAQSSPANIRVFTK
jgi:hypothetical protein